MVDLDSVWIGAAHDAFDDPEGAVEEAITRYLPDAFREVSCVWQLSSSMGTTGKPGTFSGHLWYWLDRPVGSEALRRFFSAEVPNADASVFTAVQPHYVANPIFAGVAVDPLPRRVGLLRLDSDVLRLPEIDVGAMAQAAQAAGKGGLIGDVKGFEAKLAKLGDGPGLLGFNAVIPGAVAAYCAKRLQIEVDAEALKERIREAIDTAPKDLHKRKPGDLARYQSDAYLDEAIRSAVGRFCKKYIAPRYRKGSHVDRAREKILSIIEDYLRDVSHSLAGITSAPPPGVMGLAVDVGLGKTRAAIHAITQLRGDVEILLAGMKATIEEARAGGADDADIEALIDRRRELRRTRRAVFAVPTHNLAEELVDRIRAETALTAAVCRGREAYDPDGDEDDLKMCWKPDAAKEIAALGLSVETVLCKSADGSVQCTFFHDCSYQRQKKLCRTADVVAVPHASLFHEMPRIGRHGVLIIDESFWETGLSEARIMPSTCRQGGKAEPGIQFGIPAAAAWAMIADMLNNLPLNACLDPKLIPFSKKELGELLVHEYANVPIPLDGLAGAAETLILSALKRVDAGWSRRIQLLKILISVKGKEGPSPWIKKVTDQRTTSGDIVLMRWRAEIAENWVPPAVLALDATAEKDVIAPFFPDKEIQLAEPVRAAMPHVSIMQIVDRSFGAKSLTDESRLAREVWRHIWIRALEYLGQGKDGIDCLVICQAEFEKQLRAWGLPPRVEVAHYNAIRGLDRWGGVRGLLTIGRTAPAPLVVEGLAEHLTGEVVADPMQVSVKDWWYLKQETGVRLPSDDGYPVGADYHPDPMVEKLRWQITEAELIQAIGRARGVNRTGETPLQVDILGNVPLPLTVDEPRRWDDIAPGKEVEMMAGGVVLTNAADMATPYPMVWPTLDAAKNFKKRQPRGGGHSLMYKYNIGDDPLLSEIDLPFGFRGGMYKKAGAGQKPTGFAYHPDLCPDPIYWLRNRLGTLADIEFDPDETSFFDLVETPPASAAAAGAWMSSCGPKEMP